MSSNNNTLFIKDDSSTPTVPFSSYTPRVAIITGGSQGIGYAIAHRLADDGIDVAINDIAAKQSQIDAVVDELRKKGRRALAVPGDISSEAGVISVIEKTARELGSVDIMVANAGIASFSAFLETSVESFDAVYSVNIRGVFLSFKHAALQMVKQGRGGRLIAASSIVGKQGSPNLISYSAAKFAVRGMTQSASIELQKFGITVNAYAPGIITTPMLLEAGSAEDPSLMIKKLTGMPMDAPVATPDTIASIVSYIAKPESYFVNGQTIIVDGGFRFD